MASKEQRLVNAIQDRQGELLSARSSEQAQWEEISSFCYPRRDTFYEETQAGGQRKRFILDSTAARSLELAASNVFHFNNNPASKWFDVSIGNGERDEEVGVATWRTNTIDKVMSVVNLSMTTNIYAELFATYMDLIGLGTSITFCDERAGLPVIKNVHLSETTIDENYYNEVDTFFRAPRLTYRKFKQRWPDQEPTKNGKPGSDPDQRVRVINAVFPVDHAVFAPLVDDQTRAAAELVGAEVFSVYISVDGGFVLESGFYNEPPYQAGRWYRTQNSPYGRGSAHTIMPDIRLVNRAVDTYLRQQEKLADPPLWIPDGSMVSPLRLFPGAITFTDGERKPEFLIPPGGSRIEFSAELIRQKQEDIRAGFFTPLFVNIDGTVKTATQVLQESDDRNRAIAPMLARSQREVLAPLIRRVIGIGLRYGWIEQPPIEGPVEIVFNSVIMENQKVTEALGTMRFFEGAAAWSQAFPGAFDHIDIDEVVPTLRAGFGAPVSIQRSTPDMKKARRARQEADQQQAQQEQLIAGAEASAKVMAAMPEG